MSCLPGLLDRRAELRAFLRGERHRLLDENVLAGAQGGQRLRGMMLIAAGDQHGVNLRIAQDLVVVGAGSMPRRSAARSSCRARRRRIHRAQTHAREFLQIRQMLPLRQVARADQRELDLLLRPRRRRLSRPCASARSGHRVGLRGRRIVAAAPPGWRPRDRRSCRRPWPLRPARIRA